MTGNHAYFNRDYNLWTLDAFQREYVEPFPTQKQGIMNSFTKSLEYIQDYDPEEAKSLKAGQLLKEHKERKVRYKSSQISIQVALIGNCTLLINFDCTSLSSN
jgi:galactose mutarotase-like enzyme